MMNISNFDDPNIMHDLSFPIFFIQQLFISRSDHNYIYKMHASVLLYIAIPSYITMLHKYKIIYMLNK